MQSVIIPGDFRGQVACTRCGWKGDVTETVTVPICPDCGTGHSKLHRLAAKKMAGVIECPKCGRRAPISETRATLTERECPKCGDFYLKPL